MPTPLWKTTDAFKRILEVLGPRQYSVIHQRKTVYEPLTGRQRVPDRIMARTYYESPKNKRRRIEVYGKPTGYLDGIDTILHELLHAAYPDKEEDEIVQLTEEILADLWTSD